MEKRLDAFDRGEEKKVAEIQKKVESLTQQFGQSEIKREDLEMTQFRFDQLVKIPMKHRDDEVNYLRDLVKNHLSV